MVLDRSDVESQRIVYVQTWHPPRQNELPRCFRPEFDELRREEYRWMIPTPSSLPEEVAITLEADDRYQDFLFRLERAMAGGVRKVYLNIEAP